MSKVKINITIDEKLLNDVDDYCDKNFMNRSWLISQSLVKNLNEQKVINAVANMSVAIKKCVDNGQIDDDTRRELEGYEAICKLFVGK